MAAVMTAVVATARARGHRQSRKQPRASHGTQARAAVCGKSAQDIMPPPRVKPAATSQAAAREMPSWRARSQVPSNASSIFSANRPSRKCWIASGRASMASGDSTPAWGLFQSELPPSSRSDHSGRRCWRNACRISSSHGRNWYMVSLWTRWEKRTGGSPGNGSTPAMTPVGASSVSSNRYGDRMSSGRARPSAIARRSSRVPRPRASTQHTPWATASSRQSSISSDQTRCAMAELSSGPPIRRPTVAF